MVQGPLQVPPVRSPIADAKGLAPSEWYEFFRRLLAYLQQTGVDPAVIADILARLDALEASDLGPFLILGPLSVQVQGTPQNGNVLVQLVGDVESPGRLYAYRVDDDGNQGWSLVKPDETPSSIGVYMVDENGDWMIDENNRFEQSDLLLQVAADPDSTISNIQQTINYMLTPGIVSGCILSRLDVDTARISAGRVLFATADDDGDSDLKFFNVPQVDFDIPADQETRYFAWTYNGGSPVAVMQTVDDFNRDTDIPVGLATRFNGTMVVTPNRYRTSQPITNVIQRGDALAPILRDADVGGITLGALAGRITTISGGRLWARLEDFTIPSQASNTATMVSTHFNGTGLTFTTGLTQWDNARFNNLGAGTLQAMGLNKWAVLWFFIAVDGTYGFAYGTGEHNTQGAAANEALPPYLNQDFFRQAYLVGRYVFQQGQDIPSLVEQQLSALTNVSVINDHNSLANLQVDGGAVAGEYYHISAAQAADVATLSTGGTTGQFWRGDQVYSNTLVGDFTANAGTINQTGTVTGSAFLLRINGNLNNNNTSQQSVATYQAGVSPSGASLTDLQGLLFLPSLFSSAANVTNVNCITARADAAASYTGTVTNIVAFNALNPSWSGSVIPANYRGLTVANITNFTSTARGVNLNLNAGTGKHNVYAGGTADNHFGGNVGIGTTTPATPLHVVGNTTQAGARLETAVVSPAQLTADTNDWAVAGITTAAIIRATTDASRNLTGIASPTSGQMIRLINVGAQDLVLVHDATSTAANRFLLPNSANLTLNPNDSVSLWYDNTSSRWRALGV